MSRELEALERAFDGGWDYNGDYEDYGIIKSALERNEKLEKVWEIVKEKHPRISLIKSMIKTNSVDFDEYNCAVFSYQQLTETEFNLLKEMLEEK